MRKKYTYLMVASLLFSVMAGATRAEANIKDDIGTVIDKPGVYKTIPDIVKTDFGRPADWIKSGIYSYEFLDDAKKYITIRYIDNVGKKLVIPETVDGHKVIGVGCFGLSEEPSEDGGWQGGKMSGSYRSWGLIWEGQTDCAVEEIVLPEGLEFIGTYAFQKMKNNQLYKVDFPESLVYIGSGAFYAQDKLKNVSLPENTYVDVSAFTNRKWDKIEFTSDCNIQPRNFEGDRKTLVIRKKKEDNYKVPIFDRTENIYLDSHFKNVQFEFPGGVVEDHFENILPLLAYVENLYVNGKETAISMGKNIDVGAVYTVSGAKGISFARKRKIDYVIKQTGKKQEVKAKKKAGEYSAVWKKAGTWQKKYTYQNAKWKQQKKKIKTSYKVYGKKKKNGKYHFIKTTTKKSVRSEYRYVKAVPVKEWL